MTGTTVTLREVSKAYTLGDGSTLRAADRVTLDVAAGDWVALVGASGSGKSTLLHLIGAIDAPDEGTITVGERTITGLSRRELADFRSSLGFVFQQFQLLGALTLLDNVCAPLIGRRFAGDKRARGREVLAAVGLGDRADAVPAQLSGGQQQRVAIARALVARPRLLLADEPTGNLDSTTAAEILDLLDELHAELGTTVILATHDPGVAERCGRRVVIRDGRAHTDDADAPLAQVPAAPRRAWQD